MPPNFLGLPARDSGYARARFAVLPVPYDATVSYQVGTRYGPEAIISASRQVELFDEELNVESYRAGVATLEPVEPSAAGPQAMVERVQQVARKPIRDSKFLFALGGEHSITSGLVRAVAGRYRTLSILQIDAHLDLRDSYEGSPYSHASAMRRCLEHVETIVPVGIRNVAREEHALLRRAGITPFYARDCRQGDDWMDAVVERLGRQVYVTVDIDGFDPSAAPGTGTPEPGGLHWYQVIALLRKVARARSIVAADLVEVSPIPGQVVTEFLAARLVYRLMGYVLAAERGRL